MAKVVEVPGVGNVEFPDGMPDQEISRTIRMHQPEPEAKGSPEWVQWRNQRVHDLSEHAAGLNTPEEKGYLKTLWDKVNPFAAATAPAAGGGGDQPGAGPIGKIIGGVVRAGVDQGHQAMDAFRRGEYVEAAGHAGAAVLPVIGPMAANFGAHAGTAIGSALGGNPDPDATKEAITDVLAVAIPAGVAKGFRPLSGAVAPRVVPMLRESAETQYGRVLSPATKGNKLRTAEIVPELIDRGVVSGTLKGLLGKANSQIARVGQAIGDEWQNLPPGTSTPLAPIYNRLQQEIELTHSIPNASGKLIPKGPVAKSAIDNIESLQQVLTDVAEKDPRTGELTIPVEKVRDLRQYFDRVQKDAGAFEGKNLKEQSLAKAHQIAADNIRQELGKQFPDIDALNKEYSFWKDVAQVTGDTLNRKRGQAVPLGSRLAEAGGFLKGGVIGAEAMKALTTALSSPAWGTASAVLKDRLADAIARGNAGPISFYSKRVLQGTMARVSGATADRTEQLSAQ